MGKASKGLGLAVVAGLGALMLSSSGSGGGSRPRPGPTPAPGPDENPDAPVPASILGRIAAAVASNDPAAMRAEAKKLRAEGYSIQAKSLEDYADEIEAKTKTTNPAPTPPAPPTPVPTNTKPRDLVRGMEGADVKAWQTQLNRDGYTNIETDGKFADLTYAATREWQWERGLDDDGIVGQKTRDKIGTLPIRSRAPSASVPAPSLPAPAPAPTQVPAKPGKVPALLVGVTLKRDPLERYDERVVLWQDQLHRLGIRSTTTSDGRFGANTETQTKALQKAEKLTQTGIADPVTIAAAYGAPKPATTAAPAATSTSKPPAAPKPPAAVATPAAPPATSSPPKPPAVAPKPPAPAKPPAAAPVASSGTVPAALVNVTLRKVPDTNPSDSRVVLWQDQLQKLGHRPKTDSKGKAVKSDGKFGANTESQTKALQKAKGLSQTGVADPITIAAAYGAAAPKPAAAAPAKPPATAVPPLLVNTSTWRDVMKRGDKGPDVGEWQQVLNRYGANPPIPVINEFGPQTETATKAFQTAHGLSPDGKVGKDTRAKLAQLEKTPQIVAGDASEVSPELFSFIPPMLLGLASESPGIVGVVSNDVDSPEGIETLAELVYANLRATSPGGEDRQLLLRFQAAHGLNPTGNYGPATAEALIAYGYIPPAPRAWPSKKLWRTQHRYRVALREQARVDGARSDQWLAAAAAAF